MIQTQTQLADFLCAIEDEKELVIDTEFKRVDTYYPILCLLQIATKTQTDCIDVLAIDNFDKLFNKLYQPDCVWIVHSARQDIEVMYQLSGQLPAQLFDTQIAASLLGYPAQISYQALTETLQNVHLDKAYTRLDWTTRPLPDEAIEYALDDVRYLLKNYQQLSTQLTAEGKSDWIKEEGKFLLDVKLYLSPVCQAWKRVKGLSAINTQAQNFAAQLAGWREYQAQTRNKPRKWILSDEKILDYALNKTPLTDKIQQNFANFISKNPQLKTIQPELSKNKLLTPNEKTQKQFLQKLIKQKANQYNLAPEIIANNQLLLKYIRGDNDVIFMRGWRHNLLQQELENAKQP